MLTRTGTLVTIMALGAVPPGWAQEATLSVRHNAEQQELIFELGPLHLEANADHGGVPQPKAQAAAMPLGGYLHGFTAEMIDAAGRPIPSMLLHHVNIIAPQRRELFSEIMQRVGAAGSETGAVLIPRLLGYPVNAGDSLLFTAMFHNPTSESYHNARLRIRMRYTPPKSGRPIVAIQPFYLDVMPPAGVHAYDLLPGRSEKSWEGSPAVSGRILALGGHLHKYGVSIRLEDVTEGKLLFESAPQLDEQGNVTGMPRKFYLTKLGIPLRADHTYRITAIYDNPTGETLVGAGMGALGGVFAPDESQVWPSVNRSHPDYLLDLKVTMEGSHGGQGGHHTH